jgi:hypothetical protein
MDAKHDSTEQLSPSAIASLFEALAASARAPLDLGQLDRLARGGGYDWSAGMAVRDALQTGADPWHVLRLLSDLTRAQANDDRSTPGVLMALDMLDKAELLRAGQLDPRRDSVRWRLSGMISDGEHSKHTHEAGRLLDAAMDLVLGSEADDTSCGEARLQEAARDILRNVFDEEGVSMGDYGDRHPRRLSSVAAEAALASLRASLSALPRRAANVANENGLAHAF